jgi:hypothetical protein
MLHRTVSATHSDSRSPAPPGLCTSRLQVHLKSAVSTDTSFRFYSTTENDKYGLADAESPDVYKTTHFIHRVSTLVRKYVCIAVFTLDAGLLARSQYQYWVCCC